jgi:hypothetical protein
MGASNISGALTATSREEAYNVRWAGDEKYTRVVKGAPRTLIVLFRAWSSDETELSNYELLPRLDNYVMVCPRANGVSNKPGTGGHPDQLERIKRVIDANLAEFPMIQRVLGMGKSGGGHLGLMFMATCPGVIYGSSFWVFPADMEDWYYAHQRYPGMVEEYQEMLRGCYGGTPEEVPTVYAERSPMTRVITNSKLFIRGSASDTAVPVHQQYDAAERFKNPSWNNEVDWKYFVGGHTVLWDQAAAHLQSMYPPSA